MFILKTNYRSSTVVQKKKKEALLCKGTCGMLLARYTDRIGSIEGAHGYSMNLSYQKKWITKEQFLYNLFYKIILSI